MAKTIRLTESDLIKLVKKVIQEQSKSLPWDVTRRPHDAMVINCLKKDGFKLIDTGGKYDFFLEKPKSEEIKIQVTSQENPTEIVVNLINSKTKKRMGYGMRMIGTTTNCDTIVKFVNDLKPYKTK